MHEAFIHDPIIGRFDIYSMSDPAAASRRRRNRWPDDPGGPDRVLDWGKLPRALDRSKVLKLCVEHEDPSVVDLPEVVAELPNLLWLQFSSQFLERLRPGAIPPTVRTLGITGDGTMTLPSSIHLPGVTQLEAVNSGILKFRAEQVPEARHLGLKLDRGGAVLREIERVANLEALRVGPISNREILERLVRKPLRYLQPINGNLDTIEPLRDCPTLTNLWLTGLSKLTSVRPLADLPDLRELSISYCPRIRLDPSFLRIPSLRKLFLFGNRDIGAREMEPSLRDLGLDYLLI